MWLFFCFKQKTADEMRISDWSSDVCSSDLDRAAIDDDPIGSVAQLEGKGRCAAAGQRPAGGWGRGVENSDALLHRHPLIPPTPCLAEGAEIGRAACRARVCKYV